MKLTNKEYSKVKEICLKEYLKLESRFLTNDGWSLPLSWLEHRNKEFRNQNPPLRTTTAEDYFNTNFVSKELISQRSSRNRGLTDDYNLPATPDQIILMRYGDKVMGKGIVMNNALKIGRIMIIRKDAEIKILKL